MFAPVYQNTTARDTGAVPVLLTQIQMEVSLLYQLSQSSRSLSFHYSRSLLREHQIRKSHVLHQRSPNVLSVRDLKAGARLEIVLDVRAVRSAIIMVNSRHAATRPAMGMRNESVLEDHTRTANVQGSVPEAETFLIATTHRVEAHRMRKKTLEYDEHGNNKDCGCKQIVEQHFGPYTMSLLQYANLQAAIKRIQAKPEPTAGPPQPKCTSAGINLPDGGLDANDVLFKLRNALCGGGECGLPEDLPGRMPATSAQNEDKTNCLLVARFEDSDIQAYMYRGTPPEGKQWQQCFNSTEDIIGQCVQKDGSDYGWVNGKNEGQFYQAGLGPVNGDLPGNLSYTLPDPVNSKGTSLHVNGDNCIVIDDSKRCGSDDAYNVAYEDSDTSSVTIYAKFDTENKDTNKATPGCKLEATWPSSYADIYFGEDNSLYDGSGNKINDQTCSDSPGDDEKVTNPYYTPGFNTMVAQIKLYKSRTCDGQEQTLPVTMARINQDIYLGDAYAGVSLTLLNTDQCTIKGCFAGYGCQDEEVKTTELKINECTRPDSEGAQKDLNYDKLYVTCDNLDAITQ
ncbi:hypothetical protein BJX70DRAFT_398567 [Aspergillus crustosus]